MIRARFVVGSGTETPVEFAIENVTAERVVNEIQEIIDAMTDDGSDDETPRGPGGLKGPVIN